MMTTYLRSAWGALPPKRLEPPLRNVAYGVVHHIGGGDAYPSDVMATLRAIQFSEEHSDYFDIAYNWGVDRDGNLYELRGDVSDGATKGYAGISFSVLAICNAAAAGFTPSQGLLTGIANCIKAAIGRGVVTADAFVEGHSWYDAHVTSSPTSCPYAPIEQQMHSIQTLVHSPAPPPPAPEEDEVVSIALQRQSNGRVGTATAVRPLNLVLLENGARLVGDTPVSKSVNHYWVPASLPAGSKLRTICDLRPDGKNEILAVYDASNGDVLTYEAAIA